MLEQLPGLHVAAKLLELTELLAEGHSIQQAIDTDINFIRDMCLGTGLDRREQYEQDRASIGVQQCLGTWSAGWPDASVCGLSSPTLSEHGLKAEHPVLSTSRFLSQLPCPGRGAGRAVLSLKGGIRRSAGSAIKTSRDVVSVP